MTEQTAPAAEHVKPRHLMTDEEYAAYFLAGQIRRAAGRLEREIQEMREAADRIQATKCSSYTSDVTTVVNSVLWTVANCNFGQLADGAREAENARAAAKATEKKQQAASFGNLSRDDLEFILHALRYPAGYPRASWVDSEAAAQELHERISGELAAIDSLTADPEKVEAQHGSIA